MRFPRPRIILGVVLREVFGVLVDSEFRESGFGLRVSNYANREFVCTLETADLELMGRLAQAFSQFEFPSPVSPMQWTPVQAPRAYSHKALAPPYDVTLASENIWNLPCPDGAVGVGLQQWGCS